MLEDTNVCRELAPFLEGPNVRVNESLYLALDTRVFGVVDVDRVTGTNDLT
jgi:hypothetical protein